MHHVLSYSDTINTTKWICIDPKQFMRHLGWMQNQIQMFINKILLGTDTVTSDKNGLFEWATKLTLLVKPERHLGRAHNKSRQDRFLTLFNLGHTISPARKNVRAPLASLTLGVKLLSVTQNNYPMVAAKWTPISRDKAQLISITMSLKA